MAIDKLMVMDGYMDPPVPGLCSLACSSEHLHWARHTEGRDMSSSPGPQDPGSTLEN